MRGHLRTLTELNILERRQQKGFPGIVEYELTPAGRELLLVSGALESWLAASPICPTQLGTPSAKSVLKALAGGWNSGVVRVLAARALALTELSRLITGLSYPSLERRLGAMRLAGLIDPCPDGGRGTPYKVSPWMRQAVGPLIIAARWERRHAREESPAIAKLDVEAVFLLVVPTLRLPPVHSGVCRFTVESANGGERRLAGVLATLEEGRTTACASRLDHEADAWVGGSAADWLRTVIDGEICVEVGGDAQLASAAVDALLFAYSTAAGPLEERTVPR
jgi:DNA-binding HxlR family transcriptional regulator